MHSALGLQIAGSLERKVGASKGLVTGAADYLMMAHCCCLMLAAGLAAAAVVGRGNEACCLQALALSLCLLLL